MGVPVNLDEVGPPRPLLPLFETYIILKKKVDSHRISALPPLKITTQQHFHNSNPVRRAQSMDLQNGNGNSNSGSSSDRPGSAISARDKGKARALGDMDESSHADRGGKYGLGDRPEMDMDKAEELCGIEEGL